jgi:hypothetical protein
MSGRKLSSSVQRPPYPGDDKYLKKREEQCLDAGKISEEEEDDDESPGRDKEFCGDEDSPEGEDSPEEEDGPEEEDSLEEDEGQQEDKVHLTAQRQSEIQQSSMHKVPSSHQARPAQRAPLPPTNKPSTANVGTIHRAVGSTTRGLPSDVSVPSHIQNSVLARSEAVPVSSRPTTIRKQVASTTTPSRGRGYQVVDPTTRRLPSDVNAPSRVQNNIPARTQAEPTPSRPTTIHKQVASTTTPSRGSGLSTPQPVPTNAITALSSLISNRPGSVSFTPAASPPAPILIATACATETGGIAFAASTTSNSPAVASSASVAAPPALTLTATAYATETGGIAFVALGRTIVIDYPGLGLSGDRTGGQILDKVLAMRNDLTLKQVEGARKDKIIQELKEKMLAKEKDLTAAEARVARRDNSLHEQKLISKRQVDDLQSSSMRVKFAETEWTAMGERHRRSESARSQQAIEINRLETEVKHLRTELNQKIQQSQQSSLSQNTELRSRQQREQELKEALATSMKKTLAAEKSRSLFQKDLHLARVELENRRSKISELEVSSAELQKQYDEMAKQVSECICGCGCQPEEEEELGNDTCDICGRCCSSLETLRTELICQALGGS